MLSFDVHIRYASFAVHCLLHLPRVLLYDFCLILKDLVW